MGIDCGRARIGVAVSDELRVLARPLCILRWTEGKLPLRSLLELMQKHEIREVLVGLPRNMDGSEGPSAHEARHFAFEVARLGRVPVRLMDERLSSREAFRKYSRGLAANRAGNRQGARAELDAHAAAIILQRYLDGEAAVPIQQGTGLTAGPTAPENETSD